METPPEPAVLVAALLAEPPLTPGELRWRLRGAPSAANADAVVDRLAGGPSAGDRDVLVDALLEAGAFPLDDGWLPRHRLEQRALSHPRAIADQRAARRRAHTRYEKRRSKHR